MARKPKGSHPAYKNGFSQLNFYNKISTEFYTTTKTMKKQGEIWTELSQEKQVSSREQVGKNPGNEVVWP